MSAARFRVGYLVPPLGPEVLQKHCRTNGRMRLGGPPSGRRDPWHGHGDLLE
ncbi:MAG: hypothetical protein M0038_16185 [Pseudomonadota bacterium]|nr:hypothetical protein [Pseudomonadota bacterium]